MIVGSTKEDLILEKRVSLTPETSKNIIGLGLKICIEKDYASHLGIEDNEYINAGVEINEVPYRAGRGVQSVDYLDLDFTRRRFTFMYRLLPSL